MKYIMDGNPFNGDKRCAPTLQGPGSVVQEHRQSLRSLLALVSDVYWEQDAESRFTLFDANPAVASRFGPLASILGKRHWELPGVMPETGDWDRLRAATACHRSYCDFEYGYRSDDAIYFVSVNAEPVFDDGGCFQGYRGTLRDITRQRRNEEETRRFRAAIDLSGDSIYLVDRGSMRFIDVNGTACKAAGYTREEMLQMGPQDVLLADRGTIERAYDEVIASGDKGVRTESFARDRKGREYVFELQRRSIRAGDNWIIVSIAREITERKQAEQAALRLRRMYAALNATNEAILHAASPEALYRQVCNAAVHGGEFITASVIVPDPDAAWVSVVEVAGKGEQQLRNARISVEDGKPEGRGLVGTAFRSGKTCVSNDFMDDSRMLPWHAEAQRAGIAAGAAVPLISGGITIGVLLLYSRDKGAFDDDIVKLLERMAENIAFALENFKRDGERKKAEKALRESEEKYRSILQNMSDGYFEVDLAGNYTFFNEALCRIQGYAREEMAGMNYRRYSDETTAQRIVEVYSHVYGTREPAQLSEWPSICKDGSIAIVENSIQLITDSEGKATGFRGISRDVTARRMAEEALRASEAKYRSIIESIEEAYYEVDLSGNLVLFNTAFRRMVGYSESEMTGMNYRRYQRPDVSANVYESFNEVYRTGVPKQGIDWEMMGKDGSRLLAEGSIHLIRRADGEPIGFRGMLRDVTARRKMEEALRDSEERFRDLTELSSDWYWEQDEQHRFTQISGDVWGKTGAAPQAYLGKTLWQLPYDDMPEDEWVAHRALLAERKPFHDLVLKAGGDGNAVRYVSISGRPVRDKDGNLKGYRGTGKDITERKLTEERIRYLASHDGLTALPNRMAFSHTLALAVQHGRRYARDFAVMFIDLDGFKTINDTLGHESGDLVLQEISARLLQSVRASDVVARLGGDEFMVLLREVNEVEQVASVARKIIATVFNPVLLAGRECRVTASIGICMYPAHAQDEQALMKNADTAMYLAKQKGKNNYQFYCGAN